MSATDLATLLTALRDRTGMWIAPPTCNGVIAFLDGFDHALWGAPLSGLREWFVVRSNRGNNLAWSRMARDLAERALDDTERASATESARIALLCDLLLEFVDTREKRGLRHIVLEYETWLRRQSWYDERSAPPTGLGSPTKKPRRRRQRPEKRNRRRTR